MPIAIFLVRGAAERDAVAYVVFLDAQSRVDKRKKIGTHGYCLIMMFLLAAILAHRTPTQDSQWASRELRDGHKGQVEGVAFSGDGRWPASADNGGTLVVRSIPTLRVAATLEGHNFTEVAWSPDGSSLVAGGFDSLVYIWHKPFMLPARTLRYPGQVEAIAITSDGVVLLLGGTRLEP